MANVISDVKEKISMTVKKGIAPPSSSNSSESGLRHSGFAAEVS